LLTYIFSNKKGLPDFIKKLHKATIKLKHRNENQHENILHSNKQHKVYVLSTIEKIILNEAKPKNSDPNLNTQSNINVDENPNNNKIPQSIVNNTNNNDCLDESSIINDDSNFEFFKSFMREYLTKIVKKLYLDHFENPNEPSSPFSN
jgi:hypothetical protein